MPTTLNDWVEALQGLLTSFGIIAGGVWAYYHYFRGRTYRPRLGLQVDGTFFQRRGAKYLLVDYYVKNEGLGRVFIEQKGSALRVLSYSPKEAPKGSDAVLDQRPIKTLSVFERHGWVEPGEQIDEEVLIPVPVASTEVAIRLELRVVSRGVEWNARKVVLDKEVQNGRRDDAEFWRRLRDVFVSRTGE